MGEQQQVAERVEDAAYTGLWSVPAPADLLESAQSQFSSWLRSKTTRSGTEWDPPLDEPGHHKGPMGQELLVAHREGADGRSLRLRLIEENETGVWRTSVTAHQASQGESWLRIRVANDRGKRAEVPRIAAYFLEALELHDGDIWMSAKPRRVGPLEAEQIAEEVTSLGRQGLYLVAGTDDSLPFDAFAERVERWTKSTRGMAQVVVLDPEATVALGEALGPSHAVTPWTVRTFYDEVDPAIAGDGRRHRILGTERLSGSDSAVRAILGRVARRHAAQRPMPRAFAKIHRALSRVEDNLLVSALERPTTLVKAQQVVEPDLRESSPDAAVVEISERGTAAIAQLEMVKTVLGVEKIDYSELEILRAKLDQSISQHDAVLRVTQRLEERRERIEALESELEDSRELIDDQELELAEAQEQGAEAADETRWLRKRLVELEEYDASYARVPESEQTVYPSDFSVLADRLQELKSVGVIFTGDVGAVRSLSEYDTLGRVAQVGWQCLLALCDYVRARQCGIHEQGVREYLESTPSGYRSVPPKKYAASETRRTMDAWGDQRAFPVPASVDSSGMLQMRAHFKLGKVGMVSPRIYYYDNYSEDSRVYVGYIGSHLRNTMTN